MKKSEVYSWRLSPETKEALEEVARAEGKTVAKLLDSIVGDWLAGRQASDDAALQRRLHDAADRAIGTIRGDDPRRAERAGELVREKLRREHAERAGQGAH